MLNRKKVSIRDLKNILFNKHIILISFFGGLMVGPMQGFADGWVKAFFFEVYKMNEDLASSLFRNIDRNVNRIILFGLFIGKI